MNNWQKITLILIFLFVVYGVWKFTSSTAKQQDGGQIINPFYGDITNKITTTAVILPKNRLAIKPPVNGRIEKILVRESQFVKAGEILAWMSSTERAALIDAARGQGPKSLENWQEVYKPIALISPIDAQVIVSTNQPGQTITTADPVVVLSDHLIARAQVDETDIGKIKLNQEATISLDAYPENKIPSTVEHIFYESIVINNVTVYYVDLKASQLPDYFRSGMNASVDFLIENKTHVLLLPLEAIESKDGRSMVTLENPQDKKTILKEIQLGSRDDTNVEVLSGLTLEDRVVMNSPKFSIKKLEEGKNPFSPFGNSRSGGRSLR